MNFIFKRAGGFFRSKFSEDFKVQAGGVDKNNIFVRFDLFVEKNKQLELKKCSGF